MAFDKSMKAGNTRTCQHRHLPILTDRRDGKIFQSASEEGEMLFNWGVSFYINSARMKVEEGANAVLANTATLSRAWIPARAPAGRLLYNSYCSCRNPARKCPARVEIRTRACVPHASPPCRSPSIGRCNDTLPSRRQKGPCYGEEVQLGRARNRRLDFFFHPQKKPNRGQKKKPNPVN